MPSSQQQTNESKKQSISQAGQLSDPVCGMQLQTRDPSLKEVRQGQEYYFCSAECRDEFRSNPSQYA